LSLLPSPAVTR